MARISAPWESMCEAKQWRSTCGEKQEELTAVAGSVRHLVLNEMADLLGKPCPARLARQTDFNALIFKRLLEPLDLGGFSATFPTFERDELSP